MLSQKKIKLIHSLNRKKYRQKYNLFVVEGKKSLEEVVKSHYKIEEIFGINDISQQNTTIVSAQELKKISNLKTPQDYLALVEIPKEVPAQLDSNTLILDDIQDPGNLGTILRTADWFGIPQIILSENSVDLYHTKVIQASMGSFTRVSVVRENPMEFAKKFQGKVYAADMNGAPIYDIEKQYPFALVMGNEGNGISMQWSEEAQIISIPNYSYRQEAESLNVSIATAILVSEFIGNPL